jgi:hypothetical protein
LLGYFVTYDQELLVPQEISPFNNGIIGAFPDHLAFSQPLQASQQKIRQQALISVACVGTLPWRFETLYNPQKALE